MYDDDRDALAAEYVLGTLSADEREQAEALLAVDRGFAETVRLWEHRLGELNVMVEAVEPPADVWDRIKNDIDGAGVQSKLAADAADSDEEFAPLASDSPSPVLLTDEEKPESAPDLVSERADESDAPTIAALASSLLPPEEAAEFDRRPPMTAPAMPQAPIGGGEIALDRNLRRWRGLAIAASVIALGLAGYMVAARFMPGISRPPQPAAAVTKHPAASQPVAILQQEPTTPAFLVMLDQQERMVTVRRLTAAPDSGRSYELWLNSPKLPKPASLGLVGNAEVTSQPIPAKLDAETLRTASYFVSLEPAGGSPTGAPSGPTLFRGQMVDAIAGPS
jgi:anti-sigma-K factor RskA